MTPLDLIVCGLVLIAVGVGAEMQGWPLAPGVACGAGIGHVAVGVMRLLPKRGTR